MKKYNFKKKKILKISNTKTKYNILSKISWILSVILVILIWFWFTKQISKIEFNLDWILWLAWFDLDISQLTTTTPIQKTPEWKTNILIIWKDDEWDWVASLTDSIILASINYDKNFVSMLSIPRDLYVEFPSWWSWKINEALFRWYNRWWRKLENWISELKQVVEKITWQEVNYYVSLNFNGFIEIIDILWWIEIDVPNSIVDTSYPWPNHSYQTFRINAWLQTLNWETALKYARSRKTTSDFDRSLRQQLIMKAVRDKVISLDLLTSPTRIKSMFDAINKNVKTDLEFSQILSLGMYWKDIPRENIFSSNINNSCFENPDRCDKWWILYTPLRSDFNWLSVLLPYWANKNNLNNYNSILLYSSIIFDYPKTFEENLKINILNSTTVPWLAWNLVNNLKRLWFNTNTNSIWTIRWNVYTNSKIYYSDKVKPETVKALELFILWWSENVEVMPKYWSWGYDIEIVIWADYRFFNF